MINFKFIDDAGSASASKREKWKQVLSQVPQHLHSMARVLLAKSDLDADAIIKACAVSAGAVDVAPADLYMQGKREGLVALGLTDDAPLFLPPEDRQPEFHLDQAALHALIGKCLAYAEKQQTLPHFIFLGDYVDRGPQSLEVLSYLQRLSEILGPGSKVTCLRGNHDQMLIDAVLHHDVNSWFPMEARKL